MCSGRKYLYSLTEEIGISTRGGGSVRPRKFKEMYEAYDN